jgi:hypothetical protein
MSLTEFLPAIEAHIVDTNNILIAADPLNVKDAIADFCGVKLSIDDLANVPDFAEKTVYLYGDISKFDERSFERAARVFAIGELSSGYNQSNEGKTWQLVNLGRVPIGVHGVGVYYRRFFDLGEDLFDRISTEHTFQSLTESNKPGKAHRTGIYLTPVDREDEELHFRLLRCSTNLSGPTENFRTHDSYIVDALNREANTIFKHHAPLNHVLAQIYHNTPATTTQKQAKAKISAHADKTKDMPVNGIMAFCTFYEGLNRLAPVPADAFDRGYKGVSGLTKLHFRLKPSVEALPGCNLPTQFVLTLYPNSVFFMPLSTNRLYTHEIRSSVLDAELLPTRLGYVVRCSSTEAVHKDGRTFLKQDNGKLVDLVPPTIEGTAELRRLYAAENQTPSFIDYGDRFLFSLNAGDYLAPQI